LTSVTGLQYKIIKNGKGPKLSLQDKVSLHFRAKLFTGQNLWSTDPQQPWVHHLDKALPGLREVDLQMQVGAKWQLCIPPHLAFGKTGFE
jgi:FKBP-type peptidyl-prolyl cis-trans isomerase